MRISFDLDDTLICYGGATSCVPRLSWLLRLFVRDEPLRLGTPDLVEALRQRGHDVWIYTTSIRGRWRLRCWLRLHGVRVTNVINRTLHDASFGVGSSPTKRPHAFGIHLHVDDSPGVAEEGERYRFNVCVVDPLATDWKEQVLTAVDRLATPSESR